MSVYQQTITSFFKPYLLFLCLFYGISLCVWLTFQNDFGEAAVRNWLLTLVCSFMPILHNDIPRWRAFIYALLPVALFNFVQLYVAYGFFEYSVKNDMDRMSIVYNVAFYFVLLGVCGYAARKFTGSPFRVATNPKASLS